MLELRKEGGCYPEALLGVNVGLAFVDAAIAVFALAQVSARASASIYSFFMCIFFFRLREFDRLKLYMGLV